MPTMHAYGYGYALMPTSFLINTIIPAHLGLCIYGALFSQSLSLLEYHFIYRYLAICKSNCLYVFNSWKYFIIHLLIWLLMGLVWGLITHLFLSSQTLADHFREPLWEIYGFDVNKTAIVGPLYKRQNELGEVVWDWTNLFALGVVELILGASFAVIIFCTWQIQKTLKTTAMSEKSIRLQHELFRALLVQTIVPGIFEYTPGDYRNALITKFGTRIRVLGANEHQLAGSCSNH
ncbi:unnamed protein product, partial [Mesorhabditis belari]|uniref:Uncharacterized protein n=1 Tax=Mesorhabditis belari TaxID=2138241 RepID=A0AAF3F907_9BILA